MSEYPNFEANFKSLKARKVIPADVSENHVPAQMMQAINDLGDRELDVLEKLAYKTDSHLFLSPNRGGNPIIMGL